MKYSYYFVLFVSSYRIQVSTRGMIGWSCE